MFKRLRVSILLAGVLAWCSPAWATPPTPITIGTGSTTAAAGSYSITTNADCPAHSIIGVVSSASAGVSNPVTATTDSATGGTNTYAVLDTSVNTILNRMDVWLALNTAHDLPNGGTITITYGTTGNRAALFCIPAIGSIGTVDVHNNTSNGAGASPATTVNTGTLVTSQEIILGFLTSANVGVTPAVTPSSGFTVLSSSISSVQMAYVAYQIVNSTASVAWSPTWTGATAGWNSDVIGIIGAAGDVGQRMMLGIGN